jgi:hypothetical protein
MTYTDPSTTRRAPRRLTMSLASLAVCAWLGACGGGDAAAPEASSSSPPPALPAGHQSLGVPLDTLRRLSLPVGTLHQAIPAGVPRGFDWRERSTRESGNLVPAGFRAFTGWAQAFWIDGAPVGQQKLELRTPQTLLCQIESSGRIWRRVQRADIEGAAYRADYAGGAAVAADVQAVAPGHWRVGFGPERTFHFWPRGRAPLAELPLCGMLVVFEARAVASDGSPLPATATPNLLLGGGGDYWLNLSAHWDHYRTNIGVGVGQLKRVGADWAWYGMGTADDAALEQLAQEGFAEAALR